MTERVELAQNAAGRMVSAMVNGKPQIPYLGVGKYQPRGRKAAPPVRSSKDYPDNGDKRISDLEAVLRKCGLRDGMVISNHHHLRDGDRVALMALQAAAKLGVKDLTWFPSASFPSQKAAIELMQSGVIHHIEGSMNGPLGDYCTQGKMRGMGVLRSHGGRWQAIQDGEVHVDVAVIAAPTADFFGNADGSHGKSACGSLGFALADSIYADNVIVVTDNLVTFPCIPWQIQGNNVDYVVEVDSIGDPARIVSGTTQITRSHGGRWQAIQDGEVHVDVAVIAAPTADFFGNADGSHGKSACGSLGFALADSIYADNVIVVTDNLVPFPCIPWQIQGNNVDYVVEVDSIGDPAKIVSGTTQITRSPDRLRIAELVARFLRDAGIMRNGFSFQAGAGGIALAFVDFLRRMMKEDGVKARFVRGGSTRYLVEMLQEGLTDYILDGQTFDLEAVKSIASDPRHVPTSPFTSYNYHGKGNFASMVDAVVLGATEVDVNFNGNVVTHSDGRLLHGIGGWQNCLAAECTILAVPSFRDRIPVIVDEVTTLTGPGELIDVVVTERGIAINPLRQDLLDAVKGSTLPIRPIQDIKAEVERICGGKPARPQLGDRPVAVVKWVDGTVLDTIWQVG